MSDRPYVAIVGEEIVGRWSELVMAQAQCVLRGVARGFGARALHQVSHETTGERWIGTRQRDGDWKWTKVGAVAPRPDPETWPTPRHRADLDG